MKKLANLVLTASVVTRQQPAGKVKIVTDVTIRLDGKAAVAFRSLGGDYRRKVNLAILEFKRDPSKWEALPGFDASMLEALAKAA